MKQSRPEKKINCKHAKVINILENEIRIAGESAAAINKAHNDARTHFEDEKIKHKTEVKLWSNDLGNMTRKHKNLEKMTYSYLGGL